MNSIRKRFARARTIPVKKMRKDDLRFGRLLYAEVSKWRPSHRGECQCLRRPCPYVACTHHLYLDVNQETGSIKLNFPDLELWELTETCVLDIADRGGMTLEEVGEILNLTRERIRQLEFSALLKLLELAQEDAEFRGVCL